MSFNCSDKDTLIAYIYRECDAETREAVDAHLAACPACTDEVAGFGMVRESLSQWAPPDRVGGFRLVRDEDEAAAPARVLRPARWWQAPLPTLAKVAAAILLFAGGAALANLEVRYDKDGFVVRTGWQAAAVQVAAPVPRGDVGALAAAGRPCRSSGPRRFRRVPRPSSRRSSVNSATSSASSSRRSGPRPRPPAPAQVAGNVSFDENRVMQRVYTALDESERRQQVNVASYMSRLANDLQSGRAIDMRRVGFDTLPPALPQRAEEPDAVRRSSLKK